MRLVEDHRGKEELHRVVHRHQTKVGVGRIAEATGEQTTAELSAQRDALLAAILQATAGKR